MTSSFIRSLLMEAPEELSVPGTEGGAPAAGNDPTGAPISADDFTEPPVPAPMAAAPAPMASPAMPSSINAPAMSSNMTIQKEVLNKELIKAVTSEMKALVSTFEKQFDKDDMNVGDAEIHITNFLQSLAFQAEKLSVITGGNMGAAPEEAPLPEMEPGAGVEMENPLPPEPVAEPTPEEVPAAPMEDMFTSPEGEGEASEFTAPEQVI